MSASASSSSALLQSLELHNSAFEQLLSLIPPRHYILTEPDQDQHGNKYMKNKKSNSMPKQDIKERSKKAKKDKLDPSNNFSLPELLSGRVGKGAESDDDSEAASMAGNDDDVEDDSTPSGSTSTAFQPLPPTTSIATLHAKLQERIASLQGKRFDKPVDAGYPTRDASGGVVVAPEPGSKEELLAEQRKRRGELRDNRRNARKEERRQETASKAKPAAQTKKAKPTAEELSVRPGKTTLLVPEHRSAAPGANVSFSQFKLPSTFGASTSKKHKPLPSNPAQALSVLQAQKEKLSALPADVRSEKLEKARWETALERAEGGKVRDDATRLKKAAKRKEKEKSKSSTEWADRKEQVKNVQAIKQKKRSDNIAGRLEARKNAKKGIKPKGDKKSFKAGGGGGGGSKARGGFEGKKGPGFGGGKGK